MPSAVTGMKEVNAAFKKVGDDLAEQKVPFLKQISEPVRVDAERFAVAFIPTVTHRWSRMRVGVTKRNVYVAAKTRGARIPTLRRPNFGDLLLKRAMEPALERNRVQIEQELEKLVDDIAKAF